MYFAIESTCSSRTTRTVNSDYFRKERLDFGLYNRYELRSLWGRNCSFTYNLDTRQSSKAYLSRLMEVKCFLCFSAFLAFAQCIRLLERTGQASNSWSYLNWNYGNESGYLVHMNGPYIRAFVTLSVGHSVRSYIHPLIHPQTYPLKWYALHRPLTQYCYV